MLQAREKIFNQVAHFIEERVELRIRLLAVGLSGNDRVHFFGLGVNDKCLEFELVHDANNQLFGETQIELFASTSPSSARRHLYSISTVMDRFFPSFISLIWLPGKQTVFEKDEALLPPARGVLGVNLFSLSKQGQFKLMDGKTTRSISVRFEQGKGLLVIDGVLDGQIVPIL